jgi:hypothetical protein
MGIGFAARASGASPVPQPTTRATPSPVAGDGRTRPRSSPPPWAELTERAHRRESRPPRSHDAESARPRFLLDRRLCCLPDGRRHPRTDREPTPLRVKGPSELPRIQPPQALTSNAGSKVPTYEPFRVHCGTLAQTSESESDGSASSSHSETEEAPTVLRRLASYQLTA